MITGNGIKVGIGFATGRKSFQSVLKTYIHSWLESGLVESDKVSLNLFVAYDLKYNKTKAKDYTGIHSGLLALINESIFIGEKEIKEEIAFLTKENIIWDGDADLLFGRGYAAQRNAILYSAIKHGMDYLIFLDDDEYPVAVTNTRKTAVWGGQQVLKTHLEHIVGADLTHGHHCGYISPIPYVEFNDVLSENDFRAFIEAISNDIVSWDKIKSVMEAGGVTYANTNILVSSASKEVHEINHAKFISGANLCINITDPRRVYPFYNPPLARGEDTFLSTCLSERKVLRVPCYTFHDGFSTYNHLLSGVLPVRLKFVKADNEQIIDRFYRACIGWIRYKPLLLYITQPDCYEDKIREIRGKLRLTLPGVCRFFGREDFMNILTELEKYHRNVRKHYLGFIETKLVWRKIMEYFAHEALPEERVDR